MAETQVDRALVIVEPFLKKREQLRLHVYPDGFGTWTIGWGTTFYPDGRRVGPKDPPITQAQAQAYLDHTMGEICRFVLSRCRVAVTDHQLAALTSLCYNIGDGNFEKSALLQHLNMGMLTLARSGFTDYDRARVGGSGPLVVVPGLLERRLEERAIWDTPDAGKPAVAVRLTVPEV